MDFYKIITTNPKKGTTVIEPDFITKRSKDLMVRGKTFYAVWDEEKGLWSTDPLDAARIIDKDLEEYSNRYSNLMSNTIEIKYMSSNRSRKWDEFCKYIKNLPDEYHQLDTNIAFVNSEVTKKDYISRRLEYSLAEGDISAYDTLVSHLYSPEERTKFEWAIGSIISGDSKKIQKFYVFYGGPGTGKSTILKIIQKIFEDYYVMFDAKALTSQSAQFALEMLKTNPLVAIQHDGDLSKIEDNTRLNSIVSHERITVNEKFKAQYDMTPICTLFMGTNTPVKITDSKSGIKRRLIDIQPTGNQIPKREYDKLLKEILNFEIGAIAHHCLKVYEELGINYYKNYEPMTMMYKTDMFFNFVEENYELFKHQNQTTIAQAYELYKQYIQSSGLQYASTKIEVREKLKDYFEEYREETRVDGLHVRHFYEGFKYNMFNSDAHKASKDKDEYISWINLKKQKSIFDKEFEDCPAQYANDNEAPSYKWSSIKTSLKDIQTDKLHYVKVPQSLIVIDFDLKNEKGEKDFELNLKAASEWPKTYCELSKGGAGIHLHYIYDGDTSQLKREYSDNVEIKVFTGNSSLRRKVSKCNDIQVAHINSGLPLKEKGEGMVNFEGLKNERMLRNVIKKNLNKEIHPGTKPSVDFIFKVLEDAYNGGMDYDVTDMKPAILAFAANSSHQSDYCITLVSKMKFKSDNPIYADFEKDDIIFYDVEVFPNLFLVNWKKKGSNNVVRMINPTPIEIEELVKYRLVGFNCRRYDNHIMYARMNGYSNEALFKLSQKIIDSGKEKNDATFSGAWNLSYTDIYDYASTKQSLKKWEIDLGIHHEELGLPWDQPVPEELWDKVAQYCDNDVIATEAVWEATQGDFLARQILADLAGGCVNDTTNSLTTKIIFGNEKHPELVYTHLEEEFEGYEYVPGFQSEDKKSHNMFRGEDVGFGGYVYANPGMYGRTVTFDVASMHPSSIIAMNCFGDYTKNFKDLLDARIYIKHKEFDKAKTMLGGKLAPYLTDESQAKQLVKALKIAINSVYGLTSATFANPFKDERNVNNIVALRGALFMVTLRDKVQEMGYKVAHIKTDSIKIVNPDDKITKFVMDYGKSFGYNFEIEHIFEKICLVNNAVYIAELAEDDPDWIEERDKAIQEEKPIPTRWTATGAQFQVPYVFKKLFSNESIEFSDLCETKSVTSALYLDMNERLDANEHDYHFIGKVGLFCPIKPGCGGGELVREKDGKYYSATGCKGYRWLESEMVKLQKKEKDIDISYYDALADKAIEEISKFGDFYMFANEDDNTPPFDGGKIVEKEK